MKTLRAAERRGCRLLPSADDAEFWENKVFMHRRFDELGVPCPRSVVIRRGEELPADLPAFPFLVKEPHSAGSAGLHKVGDASELAAVRRQAESEGEEELIAQELVDMRRDLRVTLVADEVVHHYFRINTDDHWHPTSTTHGSVVDFDTFPEQWRGHIVDSSAVWVCGRVRSTSVGRATTSPRSRATSRSARPTRPTPGRPRRTETGPITTSRSTPGAETPT